VKIYISMKNVDQVKPEQLNFEAMEKSMKLIVSNHMERNHVLHFQNLAYKVKPSECTCRVRNYLLIFHRMFQ